MGTLVTVTLVAAFVVLVLAVVAMVLAAWPSPGRASLRETETAPIAFGYGAAVLVPVVGFAVGIITLWQDARHAVLIMGSSVLGAALWVWVWFLIAVWG